VTGDHGDAFSTAADYSAGTIAYVVVLLILSGVIPFVVGHTVGRGAMRHPFPGRAGTSAFAIGVVVLLFVDYFKEAADLGQATGRLRLIALLVGSFAMAPGLAAFAAARKPSTWAPALFWAFAVGLHGLGEGLLVASDVASGVFVLSLTQGTSFAVHKALEGVVLGAVAGAVRTARQRLVVFAAALAPLVLGPFAAPVAPLLLPAVAFAAGAGAALLVLAPLASMTTTQVRGPGANAAWIIAGALAVFGAGLLHQF